MFLIIHVVRENLCIFHTVCRGILLKQLFEIFDVFCLNLKNLTVKTFQSIPASLPKLKKKNITVPYAVMYQLTELRSKLSLVAKITQYSISIVRSRFFCYLLIFRKFLHSFFQIKEIYIITQPPQYVLLPLNFNITFYNIFHLNHKYI